jgi:hypothetical protein
LDNKQFADQQTLHKSPKKKKTHKKENKKMKYQDIAILNFF